MKPPCHQHLSVFYFHTYSFQQTLKYKGVKSRRRRDLQVEHRRRNKNVTVVSIHGAANFENGAPINYPKSRGRIAKRLIHRERNAYMYDKRLRPGRPKKHPLDKHAKHAHSLLSTATTYVTMDLQPGTLERG